MRWLLTLFVILPAGFLGAESKYQSLEIFAKALYHLESAYFDAEAVSRDKLVSNALQGIVGKLDPHTVLMPKEAFDSDMEQVKACTAFLVIINIDVKPHTRDRD